MKWSWKKFFLVFIISTAGATVSSLPSTKDNVLFNYTIGVLVGSLIIKVLDYEKV